MFEHDVTIELDPTEAYVVAQFARFTTSDVPQPCLSHRFLISFATVFLNQTTEDGALLTDTMAEAMCVSEEDLLVLRDLVPLTAMVGSNAIGLGIHRKIYRAFLQYHPEHAIEIRFGAPEEQQTDQKDSRFQVWKRTGGK